MIVNYFKIWIRVVRENSSLKLGYVNIEYIFLYILFLITTNFRIVFSISIFLIYVLVKVILRFVDSYKSLIANGTMDEMLTKPIDPLLGILISKPNLSDILILIPILIYIKIKNLKK